MDTPDLAAPLEVPQDIIEIRAENEITLAEALSLAQQVASLTLGHSTLQRWAKVWRLRGSASPVKSVLVTTRFGKEYKLDREDFTAWVLKEKENEGPREVPQDPARPQETPKDLPTPRETSRDIIDDERISELENEIMNLKLDLNTRKQLLEWARGEMNDLKNTVYELHRQNGALQFQLQLAAPKQDAPPEPQNREGANDADV